MAIAEEGEEKAGEKYVQNGARAEARHAAAVHLLELCDERLREEASNGCPANFYVVCRVGLFDVLCIMVFRFFHSASLVVLLIAIVTVAVRLRAHVRVVVSVVVVAAAHTGHCAAAATTDGRAGVRVVVRVRVVGRLPRQTHPLTHALSATTATPPTQGASSSYGVSFHCRAKQRIFCDPPRRPEAAHINVQSNAVSDVAVERVVHDEACFDLDIIGREEASRRRAHDAIGARREEREAAKKC